MANKFSQSFDFNEFKNQVNEIKDAYEKAKDENEEKKVKGEVNKQPLGQKIIGILVLIIILVGVGFVLISNLDLLLLPKNSITIVVKDENGNAINGLNLELRGPAIYEEEFTNTEDVTILSAEPGSYILTFKEIPEGYTCIDMTDNFTLEENGKVKLEYKYTKDTTS